MYWRAGRLLSLVSLLFTTLVACSRSGGGSGPSAPSDPSQSKDEALARLSPEHRANFQNWQSAALKSCTASEAFGLNSRGAADGEESGQGQMYDLGLDGAAVLALNGGSLVFSDTNGFAVLTDYEPMSGASTSKSELSVNNNGQIYTLSAEAKREGSICSVYLFGQKIFETYIAANFSVGTQYNVGKTAKSSSGVPIIRPLGTSGAYEMVEHGVFDLVDQTFAPSKTSVQFVAKKLGLSDQQAFRLLRQGGGDAYIVRLADESSAVWTNREVRNLIASDDALTAAFADSKAAILEIRLPVPVYNFSGAANSADAGGIKTFFHLALNKQGEDLTYTVSAVDNTTLATKLPDEAVQCVKDRARAYSGAGVIGNSVNPSVAILLGPCRTFDKAIDTVVFENGFLKTQLAGVLAGVVPSRFIQYGGWDSVLARYALAALKSGQNIRAELDPNARTKIVPLAAEHLESVKAEYLRTRNLSEIEDEIYSTGLKWTFSGQKTQPSRIAVILPALDNAYVPFADSTRQLLRDLGEQPGSSDDALGFARGLDSNYKAEAARARGLAKDLAYSDFERDVFAQVIQRRISLEELKGWSERLTSIQSALAKYSRIGPVKGSLVRLTLQWLKTGQMKDKDLDFVYSSVDNAVVPFDESVRALLNDLAGSFADHRPDLEFARSLSDEYKSLSLTIAQNARGAGYESWANSFFSTVLQKKPSLEQVRAWNGTWTAAVAFTAREKVRTANEFGSINEWSRKKIIDRAASESWSDSDFSAVEIIASVAKGKTACEHKAGISSLAECAGLELFSAQKGKFLAAELKPLYMSLARDFNVYIGQMSGFEWISVKSSMLGAFFGSFTPIWSACEPQAFRQKAASLKADVNAVLGTADQMKKWDLERHIKGLLDNCH